MFLFLTEERLREDASTLLFILIFTDMLNGSPSNGNLSLPSLVFKKLSAPFSCNVHNKISKYRKEEFAGKCFEIEMNFNEYIYEIIF